MKGTLVDTANGRKPIETLQLGEKALSRNEITGELEYKPITKLFENEVELLFDVEVVGMIISTTWNHPFWVERDSKRLKIQKWTEVKDLRVGDIVTLKNTSEHPIKNIRQYNVSPTKVYNIEVEDNHNYFVGEAGVWVHNYLLTGTNSMGLGESLMNLGKKALSSAKEWITSFGNEKVDSKNEKKIEELDPSLQKPARKFIKSAASEGINLRITDGYRSIEDQDELYEQGRTKPGGKVTNAKGGDSFHNYKLAIDVVEIDKKGKAVWENKNWNRIGELGKQNGFEWGGDWKSFKDQPHFQITNGKKIRDFKKEQGGSVK